LSLTPHFKPLKNRSPNEHRKPHDIAGQSANAWLAIGHKSQNKFGLFERYNPVGAVKIATIKRTYMIPYCE